MPARRKDESKVHVRVVFKGKLARRFNQIKEYHGFENNTDLARMLFNKEYERLREQKAISPLAPLEHFNTYEDHATIRDHKLGLYIDIYPKPDGTLWCEHCESTKCEHIRFALTVPEIIEPLKKKGWKYKGERE